MIKNEQGITLVELLVALTLITAVMAVGYSFLIQSVNIFNRGSDQTNLQQNVRIVASHIEEQLRYASGVELTANMPMSPNENKNYIYLQEGVIKFKEAGEEPVNILGESYALVFDELSFTQGKLPNTLYYKIGAKQRKQEYNLVSELVILNIAEPITGEAGAVVIFQ
ncbi:MAG: type II secretion system protein [Bacillota bacterium]|nr:type II secretion system protein [Bacillota bacterium]